MHLAAHLRPSAQTLSPLSLQELVSALGLSLRHFFEPKAQLPLRGPLSPRSRAEHALRRYRNDRWEREISMVLALDAPSR
jgi:hypothetical protein